MRKISRRSKEKRISFRFDLFSSSRVTYSLRFESLDLHDLYVQGLSHEGKWSNRGKGKEEQEK